MPAPDSTVDVNLRLRVFAGPNGSGKSTVINYIREQKINGRPIDFGIYINADDIAYNLKLSKVSFDAYEIRTNDVAFIQSAMESGLIGDGFDVDTFKKSYQFRNNTIVLKDMSANERLAQIIADFLRRSLLYEKKKFSFETVFSHRSKLEIMQEAADQGYKVYLYFVSTESPKINIFRVLARKAKGGHDVPRDKIVTRYFRSLNLLAEASKIAYQAYYFDNSEEGKNFRMFAHFKRVNKKILWDKRNIKEDPVWFKKYYTDKKDPFKHQK